MSYTSYAALNSLEETSFIAQSEFTLYFTAYQADGVTPLDLGGAYISWELCPYGQDSYTVLQKIAVVTGANTFKVVLLANDTRGLSGKYIHQPVITSFAGNIYRPAQGVLLILPAIPVT